MSTVAEALAAARQFHQAGRLADAESIYRQVLAADPNNVQAMHSLGVVAIHSGRLDEAVELFAMSIRLDGKQPAFYANLSEAYRRLGRLNEATSALETALAMQPESAFFLAMQGVLLHQQGRLPDAVETFRRSLALNPADTATRADLGGALYAQNKLAEAEQCYRQVVLEADSSADAHFGLARVLQAQGKSEEAVDSYRAALAIDPRHLRSQTNLGLAYEATGRLDEAAQAFEAARSLKPDSTTALEHLVGIYLRCGQLDFAETYARQLTALSADSAVAANLFAAVLKAQGKLPEAVQWFQAAIQCDPTLADAYNNLATVLAEQGRVDEAITNYRRAIELNSRDAVAHNNLGAALLALGLADEAIGHLRQAVTLEEANHAGGNAPAAGPGGDRSFHSNLLYALNFHPGYDAEAVFAEHRLWGRRHADPLTAHSPPHANDRTVGRRLRIGYVSPNFRQQAVNYFVEPILASHDHANFEIFCYSDVPRDDQTTARLRGYADHWRSILGETDERTSQIVRRDQIDILVDLSGHMGDHRLLLFARKPAPVQVTYIGYQNTTGMLAMDYRLTDAYADPPGQTETLHTEQLVRLPGSFFCYLPAADAPPVGPLPGAERSYVTFGSFNNFAKVNQALLETWAEILAQLPNARLVILADALPSLVKRFQEVFTSRGIEAARVEIASRRPTVEYLKLIGSVDIALDPFPFNGHTTTCDALWQGVPTVSLSGQTYVTRYGGSALEALGLHDWILNTRDEYVQTAVRHARDLQGLAQLRAALRDRFRASPLYDASGFTRHLEAAYQEMWANWCAQPNPPR